MLSIGILILLLVSKFSYCESFDAIVLGSGISGMSASSFIAQGGRKVAVIEQCPNFGGSLQTFNRTGKSGKTYWFEPGMHYVYDLASVPFSMIAGREITMNPMRPNTDIVFFNSSYVYKIPDYPEFKTWIEKEFPNEKNIPSFFETLENIKSNTLKMDELLDKTTQNQELRFLLSYMEWLVAYNREPDSTGEHFPVYEYKNLFQSVLGNVDGYPTGGSRKIIEGVVTQIEKSGGEIYTGCAAEKLLLETTDDGEGYKAVGVKTECGTFSSDMIVSTMNAPNTFNPQFIDSAVLEKYDYPKKIATLKPSFTAMIYFLGFNVSNDILKFPTANLWYKNLNPTAGDDVTEVMSYFGSCLSCRDPEYPPDRTTMFLLQPISYSLFEKWNKSMTHERPQDYYQFKQKFLESMLRTFYEMYPASKTYLDLSVPASPLTIRDYLRHQNGEIYGSSFVDDTNQWVSIVTPIKGLYCAGQDVAFTGVFPNTLSGIEVGVKVLEDMGKQK